MMNAKAMGQSGNTEMLTSPRTRHTSPSETSNAEVTANGHKQVSPVSTAGSRQTAVKPHFSRRRVLERSTMPVF